MNGWRTALIVPGRSQGGHTPVLVGLRGNGAQRITLQVGEDGRGVELTVESARRLILNMATVLDEHQTS